MSRASGERKGDGSEGCPHKHDRSDDADHAPAIGPVDFAHVYRAARRYRHAVAMRKLHVPAGHLRSRRRAAAAYSRDRATHSAADRPPGPAVTRQPVAHLGRDAEQYLGHDFGHVRVLTDAQAADAARAVESRAFTVGNRVVFGTGQFAPSTSPGRHLLLHELVHTVQQSGSAAGVTRSALHVSTPALLGI
jgi:hypothetical protein